MKNFLVFRWPESESELDERPNIVHPIRIKFGNYNKALAEKISRYNGLQITYSNDFDIFWGISPEVDTFSVFYSHQIFNHFLESRSIIGDKSSFAQIIQNHYLYDKLVDFFPKTFTLPTDSSKLYSEMRKHQNKQYICKPPRGSGGNGITVVTYKDITRINQNSVVSEYISKPLLIDGFKFDLRIYVLVTSFIPLRAFIYKDGFARFATNSYSDKFSPFSSLTNAQLNRRAQVYGDGVDFKWTLNEIMLEINSRWKIAPEKIFNSIKTLVAKTLIFMQSANCVDRSDLCTFFELFGFDIMFDSDFHPWLLEVNTSPCMGVNESLDYGMKAPLLSRTLSIINIPHNKTNEKIIELEDKMNELTGSGFERLYPSKFTASLDSYLIKPRVKQIYDFSNLKHLGASFTQSQGMSLLLHIINEMELNLDKQVRNSNLITTRLHNFLIAQGLKTMKTVSSIRVSAKQYLSRLNKWISEGNEEFLIPYDIREKILSMNMKDKLTILSSCPITKVNHIEYLFN